MRLHSKKVRRTALAIAGRIVRRGMKVDLKLVSDGALLHDVGRVGTRGLAHGVVGAEMLRELGVDERVARICETHVLGGIAAAEAKGLGLPVKSYLPKTIEERIVCVADKIAEPGKLERIARYVGKNGALYRRMVRLVSDVEAMAGVLVFKEVRRKHTQHSGAG